MTVARKWGRVRENGVVLVQWMLAVQTCRKFTSNRYIIQDKHTWHTLASPTTFSQTVSASITIQIIGGYYFRVFQLNQQSIAHVIKLFYVLLFDTTCQLHSFFIKLNARIMGFQPFMQVFDPGCVACCKFTMTSLFCLVDTDSVSARRNWSCRYRLGIYKTIWSSMTHSAYLVAGWIDTW